MDKLIQTKYTNYTTEDTDYPVITTIHKKGDMPPPKPTIASLSVTIARKKVEDQVKLYIF